jgi:hypothetical protein
MFLGDKNLWNLEELQSCCKFLLIHLVRSYTPKWIPGCLVPPGRDLHGNGALHGLEARVLQTNPILESFGNAMTTRTSAADGGVGIPQSAAPQRGGMMFIRR